MLRGAAPYTHAMNPSVILLDLNLPRKSGREVLTEIKNDPKLTLIPVIILSSSGAQTDIANAYSLHANCYVQKPADLREFEETVRHFGIFWLHLARLPDAAMPRR